MNIRKKIIGYLTIVSLGLCTFIPGIFGNVVNAQLLPKPRTTPLVAPATATTNSAAKDATLSEIRDFMDLILKLIYIIIWPMLFLAGIALDNSMVYGSIFHMDTPLWFFRNMIKNFSNFALGFIVLFSILKGIFSSFGNKGKDARSPMTIIKNTLIAGVLIQASRFLLAALIDVSTIATYAIGGMPISLLNDKSVSQIQKQILPVHSQLDLNNSSKLSEKDFMAWYKTSLQKEPTKEINISPCLTKQLGVDTYIVGRKYGESKFDHTKNPLINGQNDFPTRNICSYIGEIYFFNEFANTIYNGGANYSANLNDNINIFTDMQEDLAQCGFFINISKNADLSKCNFINIETRIGEEIGKGNSQASNITDPTRENKTKNLNKTDYGQEKGTSWIKETTAPTVGLILDKAKGFMGPLATMFVSIMDFANISDTDPNGASIGKNVGDLLLRTIVAIGLIFPLIALAVILFIRIGFLWIVIAASPAIILVNVFKDSINIKMPDFLSSTNIIKGIFSPVIVVFALSISVIFMTTLSASLSKTNINKINVLNDLGIVYEDGKDRVPQDTKYDYFTILGYTTAYPKSVNTYAGATGDRFSWMLLNFFGIGIMRFLVFAAVKAGDVTGKVAANIQKFGENMIRSTPIIPVGVDDKGNTIRAGVGTLSDKFTVDSGTAMRNNKVKYKDQEAAMQEQFENQFATSKKDYGSDVSFNAAETKEFTEMINNGTSGSGLKTRLDYRGFDTKTIENVYKANETMFDLSKANVKELIGKDKAAKIIIDKEFKNHTFNSDSDFETNINSINGKLDLTNLPTNYTNEITINDKGKNVIYIIDNKKGYLQYRIK